MRAFRLKGTVAAIVALGAGAACSSSTGPVGPLDGNWSGSSGGPYALNVEMQITDRGGKLTGSAGVSGPGLSGGPASMAISGTESGSQFSMVLSSPDVNGALDYSGTFSTNAMSGGLSTPALG
ncbi:MAG TPA: hypothetical protein VMC86_13310, partial [Gemmatimonadales bacterium]|nr:hypothetical protein [Gemmatimonadales bacterium]